MKKISVVAAVLSFLLPAGKAQDRLNRLFMDDSIHISGRIAGFDPAQEDKFIFFSTYGIDGSSKRTAVEIARDGSFSFTGYQPYKGNSQVSYRDAYIPVYTSAAEPLVLEIENARISRSQHHKNAFRATGGLADLNNQLFAFQAAVGGMGFDMLSDIGDKSQADSVFAARRRKRLAAEISFLDEYAKRTGMDAVLLNWQRNQFIYAAGFEITFYPFLGKMNRDITVPQLLAFLDFLQIDNPKALHNSEYYRFLKGLATSLQIIININPSYQAEAKSNGYNVVASYLDKATGITGGTALQLMTLDMYPQQGKVGLAANSIFERFENIVQEPWLKKELLQRKTDDLLGFKTYNVAQRIRELKVNDTFKQRLLSILAKEKGNNIYLDFWGDWCGPCMMEMPNYPSLIAAFKNQPLKFIFMSAHMTADSMIAIKNKYGIDADFYNLTEEEVAIVNNAFQFQAYPSHFVIGRDGQVRGIIDMHVAAGSITARAETIKKMIGL